MGSVLKPFTFAIGGKMENLHLLCVEGTDWIEALAKKLAENDISFEIKEVPRSADFIPQRYHGTKLDCELYVSAEDWDRAKAISQEVYLQQVPEASAEQIAAVDDLEHCPACGTSRGAYEEHCSSCGLGFKVSGEGEEK
jgi:hypothetical protein